MDLKIGIVPSNYGPIEPEPSKDKKTMDSKKKEKEWLEPSTLALLAPHSNQLSYGTRPELLPVIAYSNNHHTY